MAERLSRWLNEAVMGFFAIAALTCALVPVLFDVTPAAQRGLDVAEWIVVAVFALEYAVHLAAAGDKRAFVKDPWRILDLLIILAPVVSLLPVVSDALASSPVLRLLRLLRVILFGARVGGVVAHERARQRAPEVTGPAQVFSASGGKIASVQWAEFLQWAADPKSGWYHVSSLGKDRFAEVATAAGIPAELLQSNLSDLSYPRIEASGRFSSLFVWLPSVHVASHAEVERRGILLLATGEALLSLTPQSVDLPAVLGGARMESTSKLISACLQAVLDRNEEVVVRFERELRELEDLPARESTPRFFENTFRLKKELSAAKADLWRLKGVLASLAEGRVSMNGLGPESRESLRVMADEADYLYQTVDNTREGVLSLIDLHLNIVSFEMNKVMRVLAVVSVLGLIPAVVGGLFGMNLEGNPWPMTLPQVAFGVSVGMLVCLYLFLIKGWLR